jgi:hypothetical protein
MRRGGGRSVQGYNVQVVASPEQVILAAEVSQSHNDGDQLAPMVATAREALREAGIEDPIGTVLADGGYWNSPAISEIRSHGIDVLAPPRTAGAANRASSRPAKATKPGGSRPRSPHPRAKRSTDADNRLSSRSSRTPRSSAAPTASCAAAWSPGRAEWQLIAATHNLLKLWRARLATASTPNRQPLAA